MFSRERSKDYLERGGENKHLVVRPGKKLIVTGGSTLHATEEGVTHRLTQKRKAVNKQKKKLGRKYR